MADEKKGKQNSKYNSVVFTTLIKNSEYNRVVFTTLKRMISCQDRLNLAALASCDIAICGPRCRCDETDRCEGVKEESVRIDAP